MVYNIKGTGGKRKTRVAFFAEILIPDSDGAARTMYQLIDRIPSSEFEYLFICGEGPKKINGFDCIMVPNVIIPINKSYKMAVPQLAGSKLKAILNAFAPDVIHIATPSMLGNFAVKYANQNALPVLSIYHTHFIAYINYYLKYLPFLISFFKGVISRFQQQFYNRCNVIYVPSETIIGELKQTGIQASKMKLWKRGIDTQLFNPAKKDKAFIQKLTGNNNPVILFASRLVWEKNLETLIRINDALLSKGIKYNFVIAGDGVAQKACAAQMKNAIFTGKTDHQTLSRLYASADVFVFTSISETIGNVVLEAMASGLPCVIANGGGSADFITQGANGFKCSPTDETDYVEKILLLLADAELHKQISKTALQYSKSFNWESLAAIYFEELNTLSKRSTAPQHSPAYTTITAE